jgi:hypothetical protein
MRVTAEWYGETTPQTKYRRRAIQQSTCRTMPCQHSGALSPNDGFNALIPAREYDASGPLLQPNDGMLSTCNSLPMRFSRNSRFSGVAGYPHRP